MWHILWKCSIVNNGFIRVCIWHYHVVYVARNVDHSSTMGADIAPIVFIYNPHSNTEMNPTTLVNAAPHSKQNKSWSILHVTLIIVLINV